MRLLLAAVVTLTACATATPPVRVTILDPSGIGACYGTWRQTRNVLMACDSGVEIIYPWELLAPWWGE